MPQPFRIYNTRSHAIEDFIPLRAGHVSLYVCGMTVYDHCHVGHARAMVTFDTFVRYLRHRGWAVEFVRNFTDIDDKIIKRATEQGVDPLAFAQRYIDSFQADADGLGLIPPDAEPRVTTSMDEILALIARLVDGGHAYAAEGSVWFSVPTYADYGQLSRQKVDELRSADTVPGKRHPADFALWKAAKQGEPSWPSSWGPGRPGWHIECSAMVHAQFGDTIDIHGGGLDLVFPHHENERAQSECASGQRYVRYWMHNGMLTVDSGVKMGKSLGNVSRVSDVLAKFPAEALRLYYLQVQYRSPLPWGPQALIEALAMLSRLYDARELAEAMAGQGDADRIASELGKEAIRVLELGRGFAERFYAAMDADFNTAMALGHLFELARAINRLSQVKKSRQRGGPVVAPALAALSLVADALGLLGMSTEAFHDEVKRKRLEAMNLEQPQIEALIRERSEARAKSDWDRADAIREQLRQMSIEVMDLSDGVRWRIRLETDPSS